MQPLPHVYSVHASAAGAGKVRLDAQGVRELMSDAPHEFDGPGDEWSPESLLMSAVASCFILTFRAIARASKLEWTQLECVATGTLERVEGVTRFTRIATSARLTVPAGADEEKCRRILEKSEQGCLVTNSLSSQRELESHISKV